MKRKHMKDWQIEDGWPFGWKEWEELSDDTVAEALDVATQSGTREWQEFILLIFQHRENKRNNRLMTWLVFGTLVFTAISAVFVGLSVWKVI